MDCDCGCPLKVSGYIISTEIVEREICDSTVPLWDEKKMKGHKEVSYLGT